MERTEQIIQYIEELFCEEEPHLEESSNKKIHIPCHVGKMLYLFTLLLSPEKVLEIGTLTGYSSLWIARALSEKAKIITIDNNESHLSTAKQNIKTAGYHSQIETRSGDAQEILKQFIDQKETFDLLFLDADKVNYPKYLDSLIRLSRPGSLLITDNVIPKRGDILKPDLTDRDALSIYRYNGLLAEHPKLKTTLFPTINREGTLDAIAVSYCIH